MPWRRAARIALGVCDSLAEAHALGIVHRDLKPTNIHLERRGEDEDFVKVLDFGIAKILQHSRFDSSDLTSAGLMIGTLDYMSPEQMVGGEITGASDLYTLGIVLYELIAGRRPFGDSGSAASALAALLKSPPPLEGVPPELERIIYRCLQRDAADRYPTAEALAVELAALLAPPSTDFLDEDATQVAASRGPVSATILVAAAPPPGAAPRRRATPPPLTAHATAPISTLRGVPIPAGLGGSGHSLPGEVEARPEGGGRSGGADPGGAADPGGLSDPWEGATAPRIARQGLVRGDEPTLAAPPVRWVSAFAGRPERAPEEPQLPARAAYRADPQLPPRAEALAPRAPTPPPHLGPSGLPHAPAASRLPSRPRFSASDVTRRDELVRSVVWIAALVAIAAGIALVLAAR
jgi:hypothetical protein